MATKNYSGYEQKIRQSFADAYRFFEHHKQPRKDSDWAAITGEIVKYDDDPLTSALVITLVDEFEREYQEYKRLEPLP